MTRPFDVSGFWRVASPRHRKVHLRGDWVEILALVLRLVAVGLLSGVGWIHLHLWQTGYRLIPTIGPLFLAAAVSAFIVGACLLARPSRLIGIAGIGLVMGALAGLIVSINVGLFGFKESLSAPFSVQSIVLEIAAALTVAAWMAVDLMKEASQSGQAVEPTSPASAPATGHTCRSTRWPESGELGGGRRQHEADRRQRRAGRQRATPRS